MRSLRHISSKPRPADPAAHPPRCCKKPSSAGSRPSSLRYSSVPRRTNRETEEWFLRNAGTSLQRLFRTWAHYKSNHKDHKDHKAKRIDTVPFVIYVFFVITL